ncbi:hypothetical protein F2Q69_00046390 [Brassica cretica]|uniref:Replication factor A C-terminal domain-containing protein n=1 Tax=Brassica cretica TaxID=69181 RepID=A0A8S9PMD7_BRACR|nr:hypothetical protein F2Q69_00046390 [Brassica cretica]
MATKNIAPSMQIQASRGPNEKSVLFGDLKPWKNTWLVHVKVLHAWKQYIQSVETMEFVLADETGQKIHVTCKKTYIESKGRMLTIGAWRYIRNFQITLADVLGQVMDCGDVENIQCTGGKQRKKLEFTLSDINDSRLPCCIWGNLAEKLHSAINQEVGMVTMLLGELQISNAFDASQMMINPSIPEAEAFKELINDDDKTLTSFQSNEDNQEDNNKQVDQSGKRGQRDKWLLFPTKSIQEMITSTQVDRCLVRCTVYAIDMDWSWYYFGCKACNKRVIKTGTKVKKLNGKEITTHIWWCETCKDSVFDVAPRYWLHLMVSDDTSFSKIMILNKVANGIVAESPKKLLNGSWVELEDPTLIPDCITDLIGKNFTFGVYVEKENVAYGSEIYKVGKIYKERMTCVSDAITHCQSDKNLAITSGDELKFFIRGNNTQSVSSQHSNCPGGDTLEFILEDKMGVNIHCICKRLFFARVKSLQVGQWSFLENFAVHQVTNPSLTTCKVLFNDHNKEYNDSEDVSTSSSKRKERDADLNDMNSTSKKLCAKNIKMEKTKED